MNKVFERGENETRKDYLARVSVFYLKNIEDIISGKIVPIYDGAECDWFCLADDISIEYDLEIDN